MGSQHHAPEALPTGRSPGTHCTRGWVSQRVGLDEYERDKISCFFRGSNSILSRPWRGVTSRQIMHGSAFLLRVTTSISRQLGTDVKIILCTIWASPQSLRKEFNILYRDFWTDMKKLRNAFFCRTDKFTKYRTLPLKCDNSILGIYLVLGGKVRLVIVSLPPREVQHLVAFINNLYRLTSWGTILGKVVGTVRSQSRNSQSIMEPQVSVSLSQENNTRLHSERDESRPQPSILFFFSDQYSCYPHPLTIFQVASML